MVNMTWTNKDGEKESCKVTGEVEAERCADAWGLKYYVVAGVKCMKCDGAWNVCGFDARLA